GLGDALQLVGSLGGARLHGRGAVLVGLLVAQALDAGRAADPARIEADQVVGLLDLRGEEVGGRAREVHAGAAGPAGAQQQGAGGLPLRGRPGDGEVDVTGVRVVPHQRDRHGAALHLDGRIVLLDVLAGPPLDVLLVVGGVGRILRGIGGQLLGGGGAQRGELGALLLPVLSVTVFLSGRGIVAGGALVLAERDAAGGQQGQGGGCGRQSR